MQQRDEQVWVLLVKAWQPLEQEVICKLLCCSQSMAQLVHATCAGRLPVVFRKRCWLPSHIKAKLGTMSAPLFLPPAAAGTLADCGAAGDPLPLSLPLPLPAAAAALAAAGGAEDAEQQRDQCGALPGPPGALPGPPAAQLMPGVLLPDPPQVPGFRPPVMLQHHQSTPEGPGALPATLPGLNGPLLRPPPQDLPLPQPGAALPEPAAAVGGGPGHSLLLEALLREMPTAEPTAAAAAAAGGGAGAGGSSGASGGGQGNMQAPQQQLQADLAAVGQTGADPGPGEVSMQQQQQQQCQWREQEEDPQLLKTAAPGRWMAKHAVLLSSLKVFTYDTDEGQLAQGVKVTLGAAAAAAAAAGDAAATADLPAAATASTAAADGAAADDYIAAAAAGGGGTLPLQELAVHGPSNGSLLCALTGSRQLTKLDFTLSIDAASSAAVQAALASLTSLRELSFKDWDPPGSRGPPLEWDDVKGHQARAEAPRAFEELVPQLQQLTHLTRLEYNVIPYRQSIVQPLPPSLVSLRLGSSWACQDAYPIPVRKSPHGLDLSHLTALTYLRLENLHSPDVLPTSLVELDVGKCVRLGPVQGLSRLQVLKVGTVLAGAEFRLLQELPALEEVHIDAACHEMRHTLHDRAMKAAARHFHTFPLKALELTCYEVRPSLSEVIGNCTKLTRLALEYPDIGTPLEQFAAAVAKLTSLEEFIMRRPQFHGPQPKSKEGWEAADRSFLKALAGLPSLRHVRAECWGLFGAAAELAAATQLQSLGLFDCRVTPEVEPLLRACLTQCVGNESLVIDH